jgi:dTDP-4-amino-4,6-dideoxygalactose transaminase
VVTVSHTAVATVAAIELVGATPILLDIDQGYCLDPNQLAAILAKPPLPIRAIIPVHLYGQPAALDQIISLAGAHGVPVLEDCSQAHGAKFGDQAVGTFGKLAAYSLYPTKNLGALGDGGVLTTDDDDLADELRALREYGWKERYISDSAGQNSRLDELQAAILRVKLQKLADDNARRQAIAEAYDAGLAGKGLDLPWRRAGTRHVFHQYVVRHAARDRLREALKAAGIATNIHYPIPVHLQPAYVGRVPLAAGGLARTEAAAKSIFSLPMYPQLSDEAVARVVDALRNALTKE